MCLVTKDPTIKNAKKDIYVYKECREICSTSCAAKHYRSHRYIKDERQPAQNLVPIEYSNFYEVDVGFHSYNTPTRFTNALFVIPKGTAYIDGHYNNLGGEKNRISSTIIYKGPVNYNWLQRFFMKLFK